jgi:hypothetical protein
VRWESTFSSGAMTEEQAEATVVGIYRAGFDALKKTAEG